MHSSLHGKDLCRDKSQSFLCCCCVSVVAVVVLLNHICTFVPGTQVTRAFTEVFMNNFFCSMSWRCASDEEFLPAYSSKVDAEKGQRRDVVHTT